MKTFVQIILVVSVFALSVLAQTPEKIEQELIGHIKNINKWSNYTNDGDEKIVAKLENENLIFKKSLVEYAKRRNILQYKFSKLSKLINIATSKDSKFRIYSWDTQEGGTWHQFENVYQWENADGEVFSKGSQVAEGSNGGFYTDIFQVETEQGSVYMAIFGAVLMSWDSYRHVELLRIDGNSLNGQINLFKTKSGLQNSIGFEYNWASVKSKGDNPIKLFQFDEKTNTLKFPVVIVEKEYTYGKVTDKFIEYKFNGTYFVRVK